MMSEYHNSQCITPLPSTCLLPCDIFEYNSFARKEVKHTIKKGKDEYDLFLSVSVSEEDSCCTIKAKSM